VRGELLECHRAPRNDARWTNLRGAGLMQYETTIHIYVQHSLNLRVDPGAPVQECAGASLLR
jgi:hypothetical protein